MRYTFADDPTRCSRCHTPLADEDMQAGIHICISCREKYQGLKAEHLCQRCTQPIEEGYSGIYCHECRVRRREHYCQQHGNMTQEWRRNSVRCPICGQKAMGKCPPPVKYMCQRCGYNLYPIPMNTVVAPRGRLTQEQRRGAKRCPVCGKKRLLAASARRYECNACGVCLLRQEEPMPEWMIRRGEKRRAA